MDRAFLATRIAELKQAGKSHPVPYVRVKALALYNLALGRTLQEVAAMCAVHRHAVSRWAARYQQEGLGGLLVKEGRGARSQVDPQEVEHYLRQSPRTFGVMQERWTLAALRQTVPSLGRLSSLRSVQYILARLGYSYKRGQPAVHSPDPEYAKKNGTWTRSIRRA